MNAAEHRPEFLPHQAWYDALVEQLELRGSSSAEISDAVATVHAHCVEADRQPQALFGDPRAYVRELKPTADPPGGTRLLDMLAS